MTGVASELAELYVVLKAVTSPFTKGMGEAAAAGDSLASKMKSGPVNALASFGKVVSEGAIGVAVASAKMAGDYQASMLRLKTSAGETGDFIGGKFTGNLKLVNDGILKMAVDTATSTKELSSGMYMVESAGFHGAAGLQILRAAAEGAKAEGADLGTVGNALTTMMKDYHLNASQAVPAMNQLIATVAHGKTTMQDLAGALHSVLPIASSVHLSYGQVGGAIATMTSHGVTAELATQHLANAIRNLVAPNKVASKAMEALGINVNDLKLHVGDLQKGGRGLTGTMDLLMGSILKGVDKKSGLVLAQQFNTSKTAMQSAKDEMAKMPPELQRLANAYVNGSGNVKGFGKEVSKLPLTQQALLKQFEANAKSAAGFSTALKGNKAAAQTVDEALKKTTGGAVGLETALQLTGENAKDFANNVKAVADASKQGGKHVENWAAIQKTFNFQMAQLKQAVETTAIKIGSVLIPVITSVVGWFEKHQTVAKALAVVIAGILTASVVAFAARSVASTVKTGAEFAKLGLGAAQAGGRIVQGFRSAEVAQSAFSGKAGTLGGVLRRGFDGGVAGAKNLASAVKNVGSSIASASSSAASGGWSKLTSGAKIAADAAKSAGTKMLEAGKAAATAAVDVGKLAVSYVVSGAKAAWSAIQFIAVKTAQLAVRAATAAWAAVQWILDAALDANPIGLVVIAIAALVAGVIYAYTHFTWFKKIVDAVFSWLKGAVTTVINFVKQHWQLIVGIITGPIGIVVLLVHKYWKQISDAVSGAINWVIDFVKNHWRMIISIIGGPLGIIIALVTKYWTQISDFVKKAIDKVKSDISAALNLIKTIWNTAWNLVKTVLSTAWQAINDVIHGRIGDAIKLVTGIPGKILSALGNVGSLLFNAGKSIVQGLMNGITGMFGSVGNTMTGLVNKVKGFLPFSPAKEGPLSGNGNPYFSGRSIVGQLSDGMLQNASLATAAVSKVAGAVSDGWAQGAQFGTASLNVGRKLAVAAHKGSKASGWAQDTMNAAGHGKSYGVFHTASTSGSAGGSSSGSATSGTGSTGSSSGTTTVTCKCNCSDRPIVVHLDGKQIYSSFQKHALKHSRRNGGNGLSLQPGR